VDRERSSARGARDHGPHTLRVYRGVVVGLDGDDVFVELGPRMQGVISSRQFHQRPRTGDAHDFTLRGREDELWVLALEREASLETWEEAEVGAVVEARAVRVNPGGLELKIGELHAFLPRSHTGLPRGKDLRLLVGKAFACEVIAVDPERQRVVVSRKLVLKRERASDRQREVGSLRPGQVVHGRVSRVEPYGAFVRFGRGLEGMIHASNLAYERVADARDVLEPGEAVEAKVLSVRRSGKRIGLGLKQMHESPWHAFAREHGAGELIEGRVKRVLDWGAFVRVAPGIEGLVHRSESGLGPDASLRAALAPDREVCVRIVSVDPVAERLALSLLDARGAPIPTDAREQARSFAEYAERGEGAPLETNLGELLRDALDERGPSSGAGSRPAG